MADLVLTAEANVASFFADLKKAAKETAAFFDKFDGREINISANTADLVKAGSVVKQLAKDAQAAAAKSDIPITVRAAGVKQAQADLAALYQTQKDALVALQASGQEGSVEYAALLQSVRATKMELDAFAKSAQMAEEAIDPAPVKSALEQISDAFDKEQTALKSALDQNLKATAKLAADGKKGSAEWDKHIVSLKAAKDAADKYDKALEEIGREIGNQPKKPFSEVALGAFAATAVVDQAAQAFNSLAAPSKNLDYVTGQLRTLGTEAANMSESLKGAAIDMSKDLPFAASEIQGVMFDALASGVKGGEEGLKQFADTAAKLAVGGGAEIGEATGLLAGQLNAYGASSAEATKYADTFFNIVNFGVTSVKDLASTLSNVVPTAAAMGTSMENVGAALALMTQKGVPTAQSTTKLNQLLIELQKPAKDLEPILAAAGVSLESLKNDDLPTTLAKVKSAIDATGGAAIQFFSSSEAAAAFSVLTGDLAAFEQTLSDVANTSGSAQNAFDEMAKTSQVQTDIMKSKMDAFLIKLADFAGPKVQAIGGFAAELAPVATSLGALTTVAINAGKGIGAISAKVKDAGGWSGVFSKMGEGIKGFGEKVGKTGKGIMSNLFSWKGAALGVAAGLIALMAGTEEGKAAMADVQAALTDVMGALMKEIGPVISELVNAFKPLLTAVSSLLGGVLGSLLSTVSGLISSLANALVPVFEMLGKALAPVLEAVNAILLPIIDTVSELIYGAFSAVADALGTITTAIQPVFDSIISTLKPVFEGLTSTLTPVFQQLSGVLGTVLQMVGKTLADVIGSIAPIIGQIASSVTPILTIITDVFSGVVKSVVDTLGGLLTQIAPIIGQIAQTLGGTLGELLLTIFNALAPVLTTLGDALKTVAGTIGTALKSIFDTLGPVLVQLGGVLQKVFGTLGGVLQTLATSLGPIIGKFAGILQVIAPIVGNLVTTLVGALAPIIEKLAGVFGILLQTLGTLIGNVFNALTPILEVIAGLFGSILGVVAEVAGQLFNALAPVLNEIVTVLGELVGSIGQTVVGLLQEMMPAIQLVTDIVSKLVDWLAGGLKDAMTTLMPVITTVAKVVATVLAKGLLVATKVLSAILKVVTSLAKGIGQWLVGAVKSAVTWIKGAFASAVKIGSDALNFLKGILDDVIGFFSDLIDWVSGAIDWFLSFADSIPIVGDVIDAISAAIETLIGWIKDAIGWLAELFGFTDEGQTKEQVAAKIVSTEAKALPQPKTAEKPTTGTPKKEKEVKTTDPYQAELDRIEGLRKARELELKTTLHDEEKLKEALLLLDEEYAKKRKGVAEDFADGTATVIREGKEVVVTATKEIQAAAKQGITDFGLEVVEAGKALDDFAFDLFTKLQEEIKEAQEQAKKLREIRFSLRAILDVAPIDPKVIVDAIKALKLTVTVPVGPMFGKREEEEMRNALGAITEGMLTGKEFAEGRARLSEGFAEIEKERRDQIAEINKLDKLSAEVRAKAIEEVERAAMKKRAAALQKFADESAKIIGDGLDDQIEKYRKYADAYLSIWEYVNNTVLEDLEAQRKAHEELIKTIRLEYDTLVKQFKVFQITSADFIRQVDALSEKLLDAEPETFWERFATAGKAAFAGLGLAIKDLRDKQLDGLSADMGNALTASFAAMAGVDGASTKMNESIEKASSKTTEALIETGATALVQIGELALASEDFWEGTKVVLQEAAKAALDALLPLLAAAFSFLGPFAVPAAILAVNALKAAISSFGEGGLVAGGAQIIQVNEKGKKEYVVNGNAVEKYGVGFLDAVNEGRLVIDQAGRLARDVSIAAPQLDEQTLATLLDLANLTQRLDLAAFLDKPVDIRTVIEGPRTRDPREELSAIMESAVAVEVAPDAYNKQTAEASRSILEENRLLREQNKVLIREQRASNVLLREVRGNTRPSSGSSW